jgi:salicylate hydroxylase
VTHEIIIYESYQSVKPPPHNETFSHDRALPKAADDVGSVIVLSPNGLNVLTRLDDTGILLAQVTSTGAPLASYWFRSSYGFTLLNTPAGDQRRPKMTCVVIARQGLWQCLRRLVPDSVIKIARCTGIDFGSTGGQHAVRLDGADGKENVNVDVVIGADGVNSIVRKTVLGEDQYRELAPVYE